mgnify:CR=1 FL=1
MLDYLALKGADMGARDAKACTDALSLNTASSESCVRMYHMYLQERTPLHWSVYKNDVITSQWLIRNKQADINVIDFEGRLPLHWAAAKNNVDVITTLVRHCVTPVQRCLCSASGPGCVLCCVVCNID